MRELSLFSGAGGGLLGTGLLGFRGVGYVEAAPFAQRVLLSRIVDGLLDPAPIFGDVHAFLREGWARRYRGRVDLLSAGFPCPAFSLAGKRLGGADDRNLWPVTADVIAEVRPPIVLLENVPGLATAAGLDARGMGERAGEPFRFGGGYLGVVLHDLTRLGFDSDWTSLGAWEVGARHYRDRLWIVAHAPAAERDAVRQLSERIEQLSTERWNALAGDAGEDG